MAMCDFFPPALPVPFGNTAGREKTWSGIHSSHTVMAPVKTDSLMVPSFIPKLRPARLPSVSFLAYSLPHSKATHCLIPKLSIPLPHSKATPCLIPTLPCLIPTHPCLIPRLPCLIPTHPCLIPRLPCLIPKLPSASPSHLTKTQSSATLNLPT